MSNTKRVAGLASGGQTKRVSAVIAANITARTELPSIDTVASGGTDAWGGAWGTSWGTSWGSGGSSFEIFPATRRVTGHPSADNDARVTVDYFLLLEGDESGLLLLEGDAAGDAMGLEGDETDLGGTTTKRVVQ